MGGAVKGHRARPEPATLGGMSIHALAEARIPGIAVVLLAAAACSAPPPPGIPVAPPPTDTPAPSPGPQAVAVDPPSPSPPVSTATSPAPSPPAIAVTAPPAPTQAVATGACSPPRAPSVRVGGDLTVESPPRASTRSIGSRLRTHVDGALARGSKRTWVGPEVPPFVFLVAGTRELFLLDQAPDGFVGLYRDPYNAGSCALGGGGSKNCSVGVAFFECSGKQRWLVLLDSILSRPDHLEVQDMRYADGVLYFNEACESYSREAGGKCSSLVAVEPLTKTVVWRTPPLVSNNVFLVHDRYLISGYGFTDEPDALFVVRRSDGKIMQKIHIPSAHQGLAIDAAGVLTAQIYSGGPLQFRAEGFDTDKPRLVPVRR